jgi:hypothetical protein
LVWVIIATPSPVLGALLCPPVFGAPVCVQFPQLAVAAFDVIIPVVAVHPPQYEPFTGKIYPFVGAVGEKIDVKGVGVVGLENPLTFGVIVFVNRTTFLYPFVGVYVNTLGWYVKVYVDVGYVAAVCNV